MKIRLVIFTAFFLLFISCEKKTLEPNPALHLIQGKWKIIMMGNGDNLFPYETQYIYEYYNDSLLREYDTIAEQFTFYAKYKIDEKLLTKYYFYTEDTFTIKLKYEFLDNNNKLKLKETSPTTFNTQIFERIE